MEQVISKNLRTGDSDEAQIQTVMALCILNEAVLRAPVCERKKMRTLKCRVFDAIATLRNLATCQEIIPLMISSGIILSLFRLIQSSVRSSILVEKAVGLLENIVYSSESALCEASSTRRAFPILIQIIENGSLLGKEHAVAILLLICQSSRDKYRESMLREGVMPGLLLTSVYGTQRAKRMTHQLLSLLRECPNHSKRTKQTNHDRVVWLLKEIEADEEEITDAKFRLLELMIPKLNASSFK